MLKIGPKQQIMLIFWPCPFKVLLLEIRQFYRREPDLLQQLRTKKKKKVRNIFYFFFTTRNLKVRLLKTSIQIGAYYTERWEI